MGRIIAISITPFLSLMAGICSGRRKAENDLEKWILVSGKSSQQFFKSIVFSESAFMLSSRHIRRNKDSYLEDFDSYLKRLLHFLRKSR